MARTKNDYRSQVDMTTFPWSRAHCRENHWLPLLRKVTYLTMLGRTIVENCDLLISNYSLLEMSVVNVYVYEGLVDYELTLILKERARGRFLLRMENLTISLTCPWSSAVTDISHSSYIGSLHLRQTRSCCAMVDRTWALCPYESWGRGLFDGMGWSISCWYQGRDIPKFILLGFDNCQSGGRRVFRLQRRDSEVECVRLNTLSVLPFRRCVHTF